MTDERPMVKDWLEVWMEPDTLLYIAIHEESRVDAAVEAYVSSGYTRDSLLHLDGWVGDTVVVCASSIKGWVRCTPEVRARGLMQNVRVDEERNAALQELGRFDEDGGALGY